jgi:hypothetical protein
VVTSPPPCANIDPLIVDEGFKRTANLCDHVYLFEGQLVAKGIGPTLRAVRQQWQLSLREVEERSLRLAPFSVTSDVRRRRELRYGRRLRGPERLAPKEFNQKVQGDGIGIKTDYMKDMLRIPARAEAQLSRCT